MVVCYCVEAASAFVGKSGLWQNGSDTLLIWINNTLSAHEEIPPKKRILNLLQTVHLWVLWQYTYPLVMDRTMFEVRCSNVRSPNQAFKSDNQKMNTFSVRSMFEVLFDEHLANIKLRSKSNFNHIISIIWCLNFLKTLFASILWGRNYILYRNASTDLIDLILEFGKLRENGKNYFFK